MLLNIFFSTVRLRTVPGYVNTLLHYYVNTLLHYWAKMLMKIPLRCFTDSFIHLWVKNKVSRIYSFITLGLWGEPFFMLRIHLGTLALSSFALLVSIKRLWWTFISSFEAHLKKACGKWCYINALLLLWVFLVQ